MQQCYSRKLHATTLVVHSAHNSSASADLEEVLQVLSKTRLSEDGPQMKLSAKHCHAAAVFNRGHPNLRKKERLHGNKLSLAHMVLIVRTSML